MRENFPHVKIEACSLPVEKVVVIGFGFESDAMVENLVYLPVLKNPFPP